MGDKGKGKNDGKKKKQPKADNSGNRPHEQRERASIVNKVPS